MPVDLSTQDFTQTIENNPIVIVDFWAPWCGPCRSFAPVYERVSLNHSDVVFAKVNTELEQELSAKYHIRSIPTLMVFREQIMIFNQAGSLPEHALEKLLTAVKQVNMDDIRQEMNGQA